MANNLRDVRLRMRSIEQTLQVTKAMNLISTAKLRKGRRTLEDVQPFFTRIQKSMYDILNTAGNVKSVYFSRPDRNKVYHSAVVVITSDKGLAGGYNANIFHMVNELCGKVKNPILVLIGAIGYRYFIHSPYLILENFSFHSQLPEVDDAKQIADYLVSQYSWGMFDEIHVVYTRMRSALKLQPAVRQILPLERQTMREELARFDYQERAALRFEYQPSAEAVFDAMVPLYIKGIIYGCLVEAYTCEQSARMSAMSEASKSAEEMLQSLQTHYNRARQAGITQEMSEIIGGSSALQR
ncbi:MAG: ATP synthase F1 subunit gamma [Spirochaetaceae bacterium]|jgi:F-type H+-transporting ATPase subunit gamma|nr:ATP synthase F1 subunit gamma [Spirochaetaceae bacterium]